MRTNTCYAATRTVFFMTLVTVFGACSVSPDRAPEKQSADEVIEVKEITDPADTDFSEACSVNGECRPARARTQFGQQVARAVHADPQVVEGRSEIEGARADLRSAKAERLPQFSIDAESTDVSVSVRQPLWTGGRLTAQIVAAESALRETAYNYLSTQQTAAFNVIDAYGRLLSSHESVLAIEETIQEHRDLMSMIERRAAVGASGGGDADLVRARLARLEADLVSSRGSLRLARLELERLIDGKVDLDSVQAVTRAQASFEQSSSSEISRLMRNHAQIKASEAAVDRSAALLDSAKANRLPVLSAVAQHRVSNITSSNRLSENRIYLGVSTNFGPGVSNRDRISSAAHRLEMSRAQVISRIREIERQVEALQVLLSSSREHINIYQDVIEANQDILSSYRRQMSQFGNKTWQDIAGVLRDISDARQAVAKSRADLFGARAKLEVMLHGLEGL